MPVTAPFSIQPLLSRFSVRRRPATLALLFAATLSVAPWAGSVEADTIFLRSGRVIEGTIVSESEREVQITTDSGYFGIDRGEIERIERGVFASKEAEKREKAAATAHEKEKGERPRRGQTIGDTLHGEQTGGRTIGESLFGLFGEGEEGAVGPANGPFFSIRGPSVTTEDALLHSLLFPGWGQARQGRDLSAGFFAGSTMLLLAGHSSLHRAQHAARSQASRSQLAYGAVMVGGESMMIQAWMADSYLTDQRHFHQARRRYHNTTGALAGIYIWNILDIVVRRDPNENLSFGAVFTPEIGAWSLSYRF